MLAGFPLAHGGASHFRNLLAGVRPCRRCRVAPFERRPVCRHIRLTLTGDHSIASSPTEDRRTIVVRGYRKRVGSAMGKVLLSVLLVGCLAGCSAFANRSQFVPNPLRQADTVKAGAPAAAPEDDDGGFFGESLR